MNKKENNIIIKVEIVKRASFFNSYSIRKTMFINSKIYKIEYLDLVSNSTFWWSEFDSRYFGDCWGSYSKVCIKIVGLLNIKKENYFNLNNKVIAELPYDTTTKERKEK